jgi:hypothetical protein
LVEARRGRAMGSSGSSTEEAEEYPRDGATEVGDTGAGSSGMQCEVVWVRKSMCGGSIRDIVMFVRIARRSMYC